MSNSNNNEISILAIVNNEKVYDEFLKSLKTQKNVNFELIPIFNVDNEYDSARQIFNKASVDAKGEWLCFSHPDIRFLDENALENILLEINSIPVSKGEIGVIGVAGAIRNKNDRIILSNIYHGVNKQLAGTRISKLEEVETVDECLFIVKKDSFLKHPFSSKKGYHLYAVEYCLDCLEDNRHNYVIPANVWHLSNGKSLGPDYIVQLKQLIEEKQNKYDLICTTVKAWKTRGLLAKLYIEYYYYKQLIKKYLKE